MKRLVIQTVLSLVGSIFLLSADGFAQKGIKPWTQLTRKSTWNGGYRMVPRVDRPLLSKGGRLPNKQSTVSLQRRISVAIPRPLISIKPLNAGSRFKIVNPDPIRLNSSLLALRAQVPFPGKAEIDAVIFDMDGTLLNSLAAWKNSASNFLRSQGIEPPAGLDAEMEKLSLMDGAKIIKERYGFSQSPEEILAMTLAPIHQHYITDIQAKPGALFLLKKLHDQGIKISVATASDKQLAQQAFERLGMMPYIDFIVTCDEVGVGKQSPAVYDAARQRFGTAKERTLVVEDALYALQTAKKAGYLTAAVAEPFHSVEHEIAIATEGNYFISSYLTGTVFAR